MKKSFLLLLVVLCVCSLQGCAFTYSICSRSARLLRAIDTGEVEKVEKVLKHCSVEDINTAPYRSAFYCELTMQANLYPLQRACINGDLDIVQLLLDSGAQVDAADPEFGCTALIWTLESKGEERFQTAKLLIEYGADIDAVSKNNESALIAVLICRPSESEVCKQEEMEMFQYLLEHCETIEIGHYYGDSNLLEVACGYGNLAAVEYLIENQYFTADCVSQTGSTPLHKAARADSAEICEYLLSQGADKEQKDAEGKTAYDYALAYGYEDVLEILEGR